MAANDQIKIFIQEENEETLKHLAGQHNQKRHGWRYGGDSTQNARSAMRNQPKAERDEYRKRSGMQEPKKVERSTINTSLDANDLKGFRNTSYNIYADGKAYKMKGMVKGDFGITDGVVTHLPTGRSIVSSPTTDTAKLAVSSLIKNKIFDDLKNSEFGERPITGRPDIDSRYREWFGKVHVGIDDKAKAIRDGMKPARAGQGENLSLYKPADRPYHKGVMTFSNPKSQPSDSRGWKKAKFEITLLDGKSKQATTGIVKGDYGIHKTFGQISITHLPTGMTIKTMKTMPSARALAGAMDRLIPHKQILMGNGVKLNDDFATFINFLNDFSG